MYYANKCNASHKNIKIYELDVNNTKSYNKF
jgi:hypothetical protein